MNIGQAACPFCERLAARHELLREAALCVAFFDTTPLTAGHTLVVPRRHESDFLALREDELEETLQMAIDLRTELGERFQPDGINLGVNIGEAAGQTINHAHLHIIPRYTGDVDDPRGGIRWMIPERARYWPNEDSQRQ
jgi:ATP adenylyltransferase